MHNAPKQVAYWVVVVLLCIVLFPVVAAALLSLAGPLKGTDFTGSLLLRLIEYPAGPMSIIQKAILPILGAVTIPVLWRQDGRYAIALIVLCLLGMLVTLWIWFQLTDVDKAADLWQDSSSTRLNGTSFPAAMASYMRSVTLLLAVDIVIILGVKGAERLIGEGNG